MLRHLKIGFRDIAPEQQSSFDWKSISLPNLESIHLQNTSFDFPSLQHFLAVHYHQLRAIELRRIGIAFQIDGTNMSNVRDRWTHIFDEIRQRQSIRGGPSIFRIRQLGYHGFSP
jgi:hypothetical protein